MGDKVNVGIDVNVYFLMYGDKGEILWIGL